MTDSDERYTPQHVIDVVRKFGPIACDPCTIASNPTGAALHYTREDDGLKQPWPADGVIWVNPPYSRGRLKPWITTCYARQTPTNHILALIPSDLGSKAGAFAASTADGLCFVRGRLKFSTPDGPMTEGTKQPSIIVYWGRETKRFADTFADLGVTWKR